jgi:SAM-dependent methyltransferase
MGLAQSFKALRRTLAQALAPEPAAVEPAPEPAAPLDRSQTPLALLRRDLAYRYLRGSGIEFGALDFPLSIPPEAKVAYADFEPVERVKQLFSVTENVTAPHIVSDLESMRGIEPESQDFIVANHVLEHVEDPLKALRAIARVLRPNGIAYLALPDKRWTFDKQREVTTIEHLLRDHRLGPDWSLPGHYDEWVRVVDGLSGDPHAQKVAVMLDQRANIHFHVWDFAAMMELFTYVERDESFGLSVENATQNTIEVVWILRKRQGTAVPEPALPAARAVEPEVAVS